jgi:hypothetical protein
MAVFDSLSRRVERAKIVLRLRVALFGCLPIPDRSLILIESDAPTFFV